MVGTGKSEVTTTATAGTGIASTGTAGGGSGQGPGREVSGSAVGAGGGPGVGPEPGVSPQIVQSSGPPSRLTAATAALTGLTSITGLTGKQADGVTAVEPLERGWLIAVEVVEDQRVPSSADVMATYEAELDNDGTLLAYRRTRRYARGCGDGGS